MREHDSKRSTQVGIIQVLLLCVLCRYIFSNASGEWSVECAHASPSLFARFLIVLDDDFCRGKFFIFLFWSVFDNLMKLFNAIY